LEEVGICLVFEHSLANYTRILQEMRALQDSGAALQLLTSHETTATPQPEVKTTIAPLPVFSLASRRMAASENPLRALRIASNLLRRAAQAGADRVGTLCMTLARRRALSRIARGVDLFWVVDYPSLPDVVAVGRRSDTAIMYETVDLVPEYLYPAGQRRRHLERERRLVAHTAGFVTACEGYADYYVENYGDTTLVRRPFVRNDMPERVLLAIRPSNHPLRLLFLGGLALDRPITELIEAMSDVSANVTLTFQGPNHLGDLASSRIRELGLEDRVHLLGPCPPDRVVETASEYDVGVVALRGLNENERRASTTKLFTYMAAGLAVLASDLPGIARVVGEHHNGVLIAGMEPNAWARAITRLAALPLAEIDAMKQRSLDAARLYSWERQRPAYIEQFRRAVEDPHRRAAR